MPSIEALPLGACAGPVCGKDIQLLRGTWPAAADPGLGGSQQPWFWPSAARPSGIPMPLESGPATSMSGFPFWWKSMPSTAPGTSFDLVWLWSPSGMPSRFASEPATMKSGVPSRVMSTPTMAPLTRPVPVAPLTAATPAAKPKALSMRSQGCVEELEGIAAPSEISLDSGELRRRRPGLTSEARPDQPGLPAVPAPGDSSSSSSAWLPGHIWPASPRSRSVVSRHSVPAPSAKVSAARMAVVRPRGTS
mmetsp:Transcript_25323/g.56028  ORF Transcript_25323/g.56028 Transcript_25323/m.56028 type:complete len:249 (-) Transcript_25323:279-1025(-)